MSSKPPADIMQTQCTHTLCRLQNMEGKLMDEWLFRMPNKSRVRKMYGPVHKAHLAFLLQEGALDGKTQVHHSTEGIAEARPLAEHVEKWKDESMQSSGGSRLGCMTLLWHQRLLSFSGLGCAPDL